MVDKWANWISDEFEPEDEISEQGRQELAAEHQEILEQELEQDESPQTAATDDSPAKKKLKRELKHEALARL